MKNLGLLFNPQTIAVIGASNDKGSVGYGVLNNLIGQGYYILEIARRRIIKKVYANVLADNYIMEHIFKKRGFEFTYQQDMCYVELKL
jgi:predicted CoA-binding protein